MNKNIPWELIISDLKNEITAHDAVRLKAWRTANENNALYLELSALWEEIQNDTAPYQPDTEYYWKRFEKRIGRPTAKEEKPVVPLYRFRVVVAAALAALLISVVGSYFLGSTASAPVAGWQTYTALNGKSQMILPDGSSVWLNAGSSLTYETTFPDNRYVKLDGEALFEVKKDEKHPFTVDANAMLIKVLGTRFNVQAYHSAPEVRVALIEGKVSVCTSNGEQDIKPGETALYNRASRVLAVAADDVAFQSSWASTSCVFTAQTLGHICKYLERWYNVKIHLDASIAQSHVYTFTITDEPLETVLQIMSRINPIQYSFEENNEVIVRAGKRLK